MRACSKAELGGGRDVTNLGAERRQIWVGGRTDWGKRQDGWLRPGLGEGMGQTWIEKETGTERRSKSWGRSSEKQWTDGEMVLRRELERG